MLKGKGISKGIWRQGGDEIFKHVGKMEEGDYYGAVVNKVTEGSKKQTNRRDQTQRTWFQAGKNCNIHQMIRLQEGDNQGLGVRHWEARSSGEGQVCGEFWTH